MNLRISENRCGCCEILIPPQVRDFQVFAPVTLTVLCDLDAATSGSSSWNTSGDCLRHAAFTNHRRVQFTWHFIDNCS